MREFFTIAIFKIKADIRMNKTTLNSQKEKHSMLSLRRATFRRQRARRGPQHFYPRSPCGERRCQTLSDCRYTAISIHALLAESDNSLLTSVVSSAISIHALLAESDHAPSHNPCLHNNFYPRSPCGERQLAARDDSIMFVFLSTLSLRRATFSAGRESDTKENFYPRSPCGERPLRHCLSGQCG